SIFLPNRRPTPRKPDPTLHHFEVNTDSFSNRQNINYTHFLTLSSRFPEKNQEKSEITPYPRCAGAGAPPALPPPQAQNGERYRDAAAISKLGEGQFLPQAQTELKTDDQRPLPCSSIK
ncbi:MAG: hypothetical protein PUC15_09075, partial [Lentisphaeria bacterium]|nr:hypothetical protein [Lentisphaeria bacterium]